MASFKEPDLTPEQEDVQALLQNKYDQLKADIESKVKDGLHRKTVMKHMDKLAFWLGQSIKYDGVISGD